MSGVDADKVYDYHAAFDSKPTEVSFNVNINADQTYIRNIALDRNSNNSAATVAMVKELFPLTQNYLYREYFEEFYDFSNASNYKITRGASGVTFTGVNPNITFPSKDLSVIKTDGLNVNNYTLTQKVTHSANFTLCLVMSLWFKRRLFIQAVVPSSNFITRLNFDSDYF